MKSKYIEMAQADVPNGRREIKVSLHEINPDEKHYNTNGISYLETYVRDNAETVKGMPLCAEFLERKQEKPYGHGITGMVKNMAIFEDSEQVGAFEDWSIEDVEIDGEMKQCLCATGYVNEARYPHFVEWLEDCLAKNKPVFGSIEFTPAKGNTEIMYLDGWKEKGRVPTVYDYSGFSIISVTPADKSARLLYMSGEIKEHDIFDDVFGNLFERGTDAQKDGFDDVFGEANTQVNAQSNEFDNVFAENPHNNNLPSMTDFVNYILNNEERKESSYSHFDFSDVLA